MKCRAELFRRTPMVCILALAPLSLHGQSSTEPPAYGSSTTLTSNSSTLTLPGSLNLTTVVSAPDGGGVPTGMVNFLYDTSNKLGSANLTILPQTQKFPSTPSNTFSFGTDPFAFWAANFFSATETDLAVSDLDQSYDDSGFPVLTIFPGLGRGGFNTANPTVVNLTALKSDGFVDAIASGDFKNSGRQEFLVHRRPFETGTGIYDIIDTTLVDRGFGAPACQGINCNPSDPDDEVLLVDDFTGDGFADFAALVTTASGPVEGFLGEGFVPVTTPYIHIAVNNGNATTVGFTFGATPKLPTFMDPVQPNTSDIYCPVAIATGQFRTNGNKDVVAVGLTSIYTIGIDGGFTNDCSITASPGYLVLLLGDGKGGLAAQTPVQLGDSPAAIGVGDFNQDGKLDVAVADSADGTVEILYGNGDGTFAAKTFTVALPNKSTPGTLRVADFNGDGYPDVAVSDTEDGTIYLLLNDGTGKLQAPVTVYAAPEPPITILANDINGDGLPDLTALLPATSTGLGDPPGSVDILLNSASAQAVFTTAPQTLPAGTHTLTASYTGDINFNSSTSAGVPVTVTQTTPVLTWPQPTAIEYGTPIGTAQLNATANVPGAFVYAPVAGTVLNPGTSMLSAAFTPTDIFDYSIASASVSITVNPPSLSGISPASASVGSGAFTLTVTGAGFTQGAVIEWNGSPLSTAYASSNQLTAQVPSTLLASAGTATVTVVDGSSIPVTGSAKFTITAPMPVATATGPPSSDPATQPSIQLTLNPYPADVTITLTLSFAPAAPNTVGDGMILFSNGSTVSTVAVPANSTAAIPPVSLQAGSTAGTITVTVVLISGGTNITPAGLAPVVITVPALPPTITAGTLTRNGDSLQVVLSGLSSPRDMSQAEFHFTAAPGATLANPDVNVPVTDAFTSWYQNTDSELTGTTFKYTQPFTLNAPSSEVQSVTVTLTNSRGMSQSFTLQ